MPKLVGSRSTPEVELETKSTPIDVVTVEDEIAKQGKLDAIGGGGFLGEVSREPGSPNLWTPPGPLAAKPDATSQPSWTSPGPHLAAKP